MEYDASWGAVCLNLKHLDIICLVEDTAYGIDGTTAQLLELDV